MKKKIYASLQYLFIALLMFMVSRGHAADPYNGKYCKGEGDQNYLRLIDESFAFFHPNPVVPNVSMLYEPKWDTFLESGGWDAWWIQKRIASLFFKTR